MPRISSHFRALGFDKTTRAAPTNDPPSPRAWKRLKADIKLGVAEKAGVDLRNVRSKEEKEHGIERTGLRGLAGVKLTGSYGAKAVLDQLLEFRSNGKPIADLSDLELVQVYKNVKRNASIMTAIKQIHGNPSELYDVAAYVAQELTAEMRHRGMRADDIKLKPFDIERADNADIVNALESLLSKIGRDRLYPQEEALEKAWELPIQIGDNPRSRKGKLLLPRSFLDLVEEHRAVFASPTFWSHKLSQDNFEALGLALSVAHLRAVSAHIKAGGEITPWHLDSLARSLKSRDGGWDETFGKRIMEVTLSEESPKPLLELTRIVSDYYLEQRDRDEPDAIFNFQGKTALINLNGEANLAKSQNNLNEAFANNDPDKAISHLATAFSDYANSTGFMKGTFIEPLEAMVEPVPPVIFHP